MADGLAALGIRAEPAPDGIAIEGGRLGGGTVDSHGDHRVAMSFAVAALRAAGTVRVEDCENVNTSFPGFAGVVKGLGLDVREEQGAGHDRE
jgi:3-phosphoshikimate 1-carboxyvinyltransferase